MLVNDDNRVKIIPGKMFFTETSEPIGGYVIEGTESVFLDFIIRRRSLPKLGDNFKPTGERYELWEVCRSNKSLFSKNEFEAYLKAVDWLNGDIKF